MDNPSRSVKCKYHPLVVPVSTLGTEHGLHPVRYDLPHGSIFLQDATGDIFGCLTGMDEQIWLPPPKGMTPR